MAAVCIEIDALCREWRVTTYDHATPEAASIRSTVIPCSKTRTPAASRDLSAVPKRMCSSCGDDGRMPSSSPYKKKETARGMAEVNGRFYADA